MSNHGVGLIQEAKDLEKRSLHWEASEKYRDALLDLNKTKGMNKEKALCKRKIREMNILKAETFTKVPFQLELSDRERRETDLFMLSLEEKSIDDALEAIGKSLIFHPDHSLIADEAKQAPSIFFQITNFDTQDEQGNFVQGGNDPNLVSMNQIYMMDQIKKSYLLLEPTVSSFMQERNLSHEDLFGYFSSRDIFSKDTLATISAGCQRFFAADYISALCVLVPVFEGAFFEMMAQVGGNHDLIKAQMQKKSKGKVWTQDRTLGEDLMKSQEVKGVLGDNFCEHVAFSYFSPLGIKLRHKIAHGEMREEEYNIQNATLALYFLLTLVSCKKVHINEA